MTLDALRTSTVKRLEELAEAMTNGAINMTPAAAPTADQYAMAQVDRLAQARAYMAAAKIITDEYRKLTQPQDQPAEATVTEMPKKQRTMY